MENKYNLKDLELKTIVEALKNFDNNKTVTANALGVTLKTLYNKIHAYDLDVLTRSRKTVEETVND